MTLTILSVAYPLAPAGPDAVGGAEQVLSCLDQAIVDAGHTSVVVATEGSTTRGVLVPTPRPTGPLDEAAQARAQAATRDAIRHALATYPIDVVHMHGLDFDRYLPDGGVPLLATLHLPPHTYAPLVWSLKRPRTYLHGVSRTQHARLPATDVPLLEPIPNGVPIDQLRPAPQKDDVAAVLGRVCPEKGFHLAVEAARKAGLRLLLAGRVFPYAAHERYFREILAPLLRPGRARFLGPLGRSAKRRLLGRARCLLVPSQIPETSSLVAMEALACGTPVIAFRAGALAEIVEHGRTGFLVDSVDEMAAAMQHVEAIDPTVCRQVAEARFSAAGMAARYLERYQRLAQPLRLAQPPRLAAPGLAVDEARSTADLEAVREEWAALWRRSRAPSVFQHPDWLIPWCRPFDVNEPWLLLARLGRRLVGVAPFLVYERVGQRVLTLMGAGVSDDQGIVAEAGEEDAVLQAVWAHLARHRQRFDVCELENLRGDARLLRPPPAPWRAGAPRTHDVRPVLRLPDGVSRLEQVVPPSMLKQVRYRQQRAARDGLRVSVEHATPATFGRLFDGLVRLHRARWTARGVPGVLPPPLAAFHRQAAARLLDQGLLRLHGLHLGDALAAVSYGYYAAGRTVYYLPGFDPGFDRYSPGNLLLAEAIEYAIEHDQACAFDFLRGGEAYKYAWGATDEPLYAVTHAL
jgi:CelD/BcsL family acetyltransferase involved in cellulose biosynthesis/glycosyltransferase involved in cell wall biosynthesis